MGIFKKLKKAFKKVTGFVKKNIKRVVKFTKKQIKRIKSSKILKALVIAAAIVVTGGAALTAFGGTGALATSKLGVFMMNTSAKMVGGTVFTGATTTLGQAAQTAGNFAIKTVSKPFAALGGAVGSTARVGANILDPTKTLFEAGGGRIPLADTSGRTLTSTGIGTTTGGQAAQSAFSGTALTGTVPVATTPVVGGKPIPKTTAQKVGGYALDALGTVATGVAVGYAQQELLGGDPTGGYGSNLRVEGASNKDPLQIYAASRGIDVGSIYNNMTYGTADPGFANAADLYTQETMAVA
tara:strand:- start:1797 stop:2687 length:891 start_codon:yes stop_codon:yes gene_type:complete